MALPLSGTNIQLLANIPFKNDYKHTRYFSSVSEQSNWFDRKTVVHSMVQANYQRIEGSYVVRVNKHIDELWNVNYLRFRNQHYTDKWFYCFVTKMEYENKMNTKIYFEVDVFQTWFLNTSFQPSYIVREHTNRWNADGTPVINTVDEGLDYGSEYDVKSIDQLRPSNGVMFLVIVCKSLMHGENAKKITPITNGIPQPLSFYIHPFMADGSVPQSNYESLSNIQTVLKGLYSQDDAVNNVVSLYVTEYIGYDLVDDGQTVNFPDGKFQKVSIADDVNENFTTVYVEDFPYYQTKQIEVWQNKYNRYDQPEESKLMMHPYMTLELTDFQGTSENYKLEYIEGEGLSIGIKGSLGTSNKVAYAITEYNTTMKNINDNLKHSLNHAVISDSANDIPILNDYLSAYLQGNRNSLNVQRRSIEFNGVMGAIGSIGGLRQNPVSTAMEMGSGIGNTVLQLEGLQAKKADIANKPANLTKQGSNTYFENGNIYRGLYIITKQIKPEYQKKLSDFFHMYGYKLNEVKIPNLKTRTNWNHVQTVSCVLKGTLPQEEHTRLQKVFDDGITLWHTDDIGNYGLSNDER